MIKAFQSKTLLLELNPNGFFTDSKIVDGFMESADVVAPTLTTTRAYLLDDKSKTYALLSLHSIIEHKVPAPMRKEWIIEKV